MSSISIGAEVRHLLWLQMRLMRSSLRGGKSQDLWRIIGFGLLLLLMVPGILGLNGLLVWVYRSLDAVAAAEIAGIIFSFVILSWLLTPVSNTQLVEPFHLPSLFQHPVSLNGLVVGGLAVNMFSVGFLTTVPFVLSGIAGLPRSLLAAPQVLISGLLFLAAVIIIKALIDDVFDLIAEDRRLRMVAILVALLPIVVIYGAQLYLQVSFMPGGQEPNLNIQSTAELNQFLADARVSRFLIWQPGGWLGRAAEAAALGDLPGWAMWTAFLLGFVLVGYAVHYLLLRRLYFGELVRVKGKAQAGTSQLRASRWRVPLVSPETSEALLGMLRADWRGFMRNPYTVRMAITPVILVLMGLFFGATSPVSPEGSGAMIGAISVLVLTMSYGYNVFGVLDNPGLGTVLLAPVHPRLLLFSHNLLLTAVVLALAGVTGLMIALLNGAWLALPAALAAALIIQLPMISVCNLTSIYLPFKLDLEKGRAAANESRASALGVFAVMGGAALLAAPAVVLALVPFLVWELPPLPGIVAALVYALAVYAVLFHLAGKALERRAEQVMAAIAEGP